MAERKNLKNETLNQYNHMHGTIRKISSSNIITIYISTTIIITFTININNRINHWENFQNSKNEKKIIYKYNEFKSSNFIDLNVIFYKNKNFKIKMQRNNDFISAMHTNSIMKQMKILLRILSSLSSLSSPLFFKNQVSLQYYKEFVYELKKSDLFQALLYKILLNEGSDIYNYYNNDQKNGILFWSVRRPMGNFINFKLRIYLYNDFKYNQDETELFLCVEFLFICICSMEADLRAYTAHELQVKLKTRLLQLEKSKNPLYCNIQKNNLKVAKVMIPSTLGLKARRAAENLREKIKSLAYGSCEYCEKINSHNFSVIYVERRKQPYTLKLLNFGYKKIQCNIIRLSNVQDTDYLYRIKNSANNFKGSWNRYFYNDCKSSTKIIECQIRTHLKFDDEYKGNDIKLNLNINMQRENQKQKFVKYLPTSFSKYPLEIEMNGHLKKPKRICTSVCTNWKTRDSMMLKVLNFNFSIIMLVVLVSIGLGTLGEVVNKWREVMERSKRTKLLASSKWAFWCLLVVSMTPTSQCYGGRNDVATNCTFPARWEGSWFLSGYQQPIHIKGSQFSYRGKCAASEGNKYLIVDEKGCHRCLVIYEKHKNVLQYKESECEGDSIYQSNPSALAMRSVLKQSDHRGGAHPNINGHSRLSSSDQFILRSNDDMNDYFCKGRETLQNLCDQIPGDALLYSLFRENAEAVKCPLKGPFVFTYNRGHGECKSPVSNIDSCTEDSRLLLSFQACPDVQGTESTVEELTCLATWKDGNSRYLVGLVSHHHAISNEERYRCFVYEKISPLLGGPSLMSLKDAEYKLAQSGDATCNGLDSAEVGSRIMSLRKPPVTERCDFPVWFKGPRHWHGLMGNFVYNYHTSDGSIHVIKPNGYMETRALCEQINKQTSTEMMAVVHYTTGCQSGFMCMMFYRRDTHIIEIQSGKPAGRLEDACAADHFDVHKIPYITLLASNPDPQICPMEGLYNLRGSVGPPYMTTRHKRNHNNRLHTGHGHHRVNAERNDSNFGLSHKRYNSFSFHTGDKKVEQSSWHGTTRGLSVRSRRSLRSVRGADFYTANENETAIELVLRNRRNTPLCIANVNAQRQLWIGCTEPNVIDVQPICNEEGDEEYSCHGSWSENKTSFIVARHKGTKHAVCITYRPTEGNSAKIFIGDICFRGTQKPPDHILEANLSVYGKCGETHSTASVSITMNLRLLFHVCMIYSLYSYFSYRR